MRQVRRATSDGPTATVTIRGTCRHGHLTRSEWTGTTLAPRPPYYCPMCGEVADIVSWSSVLVDRPIPLPTRPDPSVSERHGARGPRDAA